MISNYRRRVATETSEWTSLHTLLYVRPLPLLLPSHRTLRCFSLNSSNWKYPPTPPVMRLFTIPSLIDTSCSCLLVAVLVNLLLYLIKPSFGILRYRRRICQKERSIDVGSWPRRWT
jgi:hypothetical protein